MRRPERASSRNAARSISPARNGPSRFPAPRRGRDRAESPAGGRPASTCPNPGEPTIRQVMATRGGNFQRAFCTFLALDLGQVGAVAGFADLARLADFQDPRAGQVLDCLGKRFRCDHRRVSEPKPLRRPRRRDRSALRPASAAAKAAGRAPSTGRGCHQATIRQVPPCRSTASFGKISMAASSANAIGRSKCDPSFGRSAGDRFTVIRRDGSAIDKRVQRRAHTSPSPR